MVAIYARQSADRMDSISVETQIDVCKRRLSSDELETVEVFCDRGISGKSTEKRLAFQRMFALVKSGVISKIIVYKVDRISRSMLDFLRMKAVFDEHKVQFISCEEDFDTSDSIGAAMLNLVMIFAESEREIIQQRLKDNYYERGKRGNFLSGPLPFGYVKVRNENDEHNDVIQLDDRLADFISGAYRKFAFDNAKLSDIAKWFNNNNITTQRHGLWREKAISMLLSNPIYVKANAEVWRYFKEHKAILTDDITKYTGKNGCIVYGDYRKRKGNKFRRYENEFVTISQYQGIIASEIWLLAQRRLAKKLKHKNIGNGTTTWLQGIAKCSLCKEYIYAKKIKSGYGGYGKGTNDYFFFGGCKINCANAKKYMKVSFVEEVVAKEVYEKLTFLQKYKLSDSNIKDLYNKLYIDLYEVELDIEKCLDAITTEKTQTFDVVYEQFDQLCLEREAIFDNFVNQMSIVSLNPYETRVVGVVQKHWQVMTLSQKKRIASIIIKEVRISKNEIEIVFK